MTPTGKVNPNGLISGEANCGLVHEASNEHDLKNKILELYENKRLGKELGEKGFYAVKEKYNSNIAGKSLIELYKDIERVSKEHG